MSSACRPVNASVLGMDVSSWPTLPDRSDHPVGQHGPAAGSHGVEIALWDLLGRKRGEPVYRLLGYDRAYPKLPYASQLFGDTAQETLELCRAARNAGFRAVKCGWGPFGRGSLKEDADQLAAAREGLGPDGTLLIDAGQIWGEDVAAAEARLPLLESVRALGWRSRFTAAPTKPMVRSGKAGSLKLAGGRRRTMCYGSPHNRLWQGGLRSRSIAAEWRHWPREANR
jgi:hypothetical protein